MFVWLLGTLLVVLGVLFVGALPGVGWYGSRIQRGPTGKALVALTFDDGPHPETTRRVLSTLAEFGAHATFFVIGEKAQRYPEVLGEILAGGHEVALHGFKHRWSYAFLRRQALRSDMLNALAVLREQNVPAPLFFRPPVGVVSPPVARVARELGLTLVGWSVRGYDGVGWTKAEAFVRRMCGGLRPGAIALLHDAPERGERVPLGVSRLSLVLAEAERRGLRAVTLGELMASQNEILAKSE
ncbi:MAG: polysaccharide deacetylase family protein [Polyangiaceae bacterium]|nr:polysaccharide deacetylase family protein [Polyangiaceae bacterium]